MMRSGCETDNTAKRFFFNCYNLPLRCVPENQDEQKHEPNEEELNGEVIKLMKLNVTDCLRSEILEDVKKCLEHVVELVLDDDEFGVQENLNLITTNSLDGIQTVEPNETGISLSNILKGVTVETNKIPMFNWSNGRTWFMAGIVVMGACCVVVFRLMKGRNGAVNVRLDDNTTNNNGANNNGANNNGANNNGANNNGANNTANDNRVINNGLLNDDDAHARMRDARVITRPLRNAREENTSRGIANAIEQQTPKRGRPRGRTGDQLRWDITLDDVTESLLNNYTLKKYFPTISTPSEQRQNEAKEGCWLLERDEKNQIWRNICILMRPEIPTLMGICGLEIHQCDCPSRREE